jgi:hypothetical protein
MTRTIVLALALALATAAASALAQEFKAGDITVDKAWSRATPKGAETGAGYLTIHNTGATPDRLTGGAADFGAVEIHQMTTENGVMTMRELKDGLNIPAHGTIRLAPGGYHISTRAPRSRRRSISSMPDRWWSTSQSKASGPPAPPRPRATT